MRGKKRIFFIILLPKHSFKRLFSSLLSDGGIYLDEDTFLVRSVDDLRVHEVSLGWPEGGSIGTQFISAKPGATFVQLWLQSYKDYRASLWYYNAGEYPTQVGADCGVKRSSLFWCSFINNFFLLERGHSK